jgi:hypothetical protein
MRLAADVLCAALGVNVWVSLVLVPALDVANRPAQVGDGIEVVLALARTFTSFCVPVNEVLLGYWDTVAERLKRLE